MSNATGQATGAAGVPMWSILNGAAAYSLDGGVTWTSLAGGTVHVNPSLTGDGSVVNPLAVNSVLARAQALVPAALFDTVLGTDFDNNAVWNGAVFGSGTAALSVTAKGGVVSMSSGISASSNAILTMKGAGSFIDNIKTSPWYLHGRFQVSTAVDAAGTCDMEFDAISAGAPANPAVKIGAIGSKSTTNFAWSVTNSGGTTVDSGTGPVLDTNYHTFEVANDATTVTFYLDGVSIGTTAATNLGAVPGMPALGTINGATAAARSLNADKLWFVCKGN